MPFTSEPAIFSPTGVRMPVVSMSMRPLIGIVHALLTPGIFSARFIWLTSSSVEIVSGVMWRNTLFAHSGAQAEYQVSTCRHAERGFR
jgi:hypothetical protein